MCLVVAPQKMGSVPHQHHQNGSGVQNDEDTYMYQQDPKGLMAHMLRLSGKNRAIQNGLTEVRGEQFWCSLWWGQG